MSEQLDTAVIPSGAALDYYGLAIPHANLLRFMLESTTEPDVSRAMIRSLSPADRVLIGGLGCGSCSALAALICGNERVWTAEPNAALVATVSPNIAIRGQALQILDAALAAHDGTQVFHRRSWYGMSGTHVEGGETTQVTGQSTQRVIEAMAATALILDVEGAEREIFPSLDLDRLRLVIVEVHEGYALEELLRRLVASFRSVEVGICHGRPGMMLTARREERDDGAG